MARLRTTCGTYRYHPVFLYVGRKPIDNAIATENLRNLAACLEGTGLVYGPLFGTLLGMVRDHDFIPWDEDIDLYILKEQEMLLRDLLWNLRGAGFELVRYDKRGLYSIMRKGEYIDFYVLRSVSPELRHTGGADFVFEEYIQDRIPFDFKGILLQIPARYEEYLEFTYGDWRTPVQYADYKMGSFRLGLQRLRTSLKRWIPEAIYPFLVKLYRRKDLERFLRKCELKKRELHYSIKL